MREVYVCAGRYTVCRVAAFLITMLLQGDYQTIEATDLWRLVYVKSIIFNVEMDDTPPKG